MKLYDYEIRRGETFDECFWVVDSDDKPIDLTGYTAKGQVRPEPEHTTKNAEFSCSIDLSTSCVRYTLTSAQTKTIAPGTYYYDVCLYETIENERVIKYMIGGKFRVLKAVTDALN